MGQSKKGKKKRNRMCALCIVIILSCAIGISLWKIKNLETLAEIQSAGMYLFRGCGGVILSIDISSKFFKHKNIKQIYRFLIRHVAVWAVVLVMIFGSIITVSATGKTGQCGTGTEQTEALRGQISDVYTYFSDGENEEKAVLARDMLKAIEAWEAIY